MKICIISYEYAPFPGGGIATYHNAAAKMLAAAGHEVHVITNSAAHGKRDPASTQRRWQEGNLTIHRLHYFDDKRVPPDHAGFLDVIPSRYEDRMRTWASEPSNQAAYKAASYVESLHADIHLDVIETPEFFAEAFYIIRRRLSGEANKFPPVCVHGHISSRIAFGTNQHAWELGWYPHRQMMLREEYCLQHADALITPSKALMAKYQDTFAHLPELRATIPYFLELPEDCEQLPDGIDASRPYLVTIGRMEPRKGSDQAMQAFNLLADDYPDLQLVFLGKEMWHQGEAIDDVIALHVDARHRGRILRLGNVPRTQALATAKRAAAFLHPVPWDNYPCANMEAMGVGAVCIVSDSGGQAEMVEHQVSGLIHPAGDIAALAASLRTVLDNPKLASTLRAGAKLRIQELTDPAQLLARKLEVFEAMVAREVGRQAGQPGGLALAPELQVREPLPTLPGAGTILLDAGSASIESIASSTKMLNEELQSSPNWQVAVLLDPGQQAELPAAWRRISTLARPVWMDLPAEHGLVYLLAGTRLDQGRLRHLIAQSFDAKIPCGSFHWLRPADARVFPYSPDFGIHDLLIGGRVLPPIFAVKAQYMQHCEFLSGLYKPHHRLCALMAAIAAKHDMLFQHCGTVSGDFYGDLPLVSDDIQLRSLGYLDILGLVPRQLTLFGNTAIPMTPTADTENRIAAARREGQESVTTKGEALPPVASGNGIDPQQLAELERVYREHMALKNSRLARALRKLGAFNVIRRIFPKSKRGLGSGH